ncbi:hypothetical protein DFH08DRAFT_1084482 [Mycena albidolilacea]|uniref:Uncharacterized protein n=1 Tax=Mycena albidolilacea TaxID=1033008 RepID=A0AAD6ZML6_9AGAR|nr:hypothetical protein DFH08DRAFT_1084482 [Mycena albidolilacea]
MPPHGLQMGAAASPVFATLMRARYIRNDLMPSVHGWNVIVAAVDGGRVALKPHTQSSSIAGQARSTAQSSLHSEEPGADFGGLHAPLFVSSFVLYRHILRRRSDWMTAARLLHIHRPRLEIYSSRFSKNAIPLGMFARPLAHVFPASTSSNKTPLLAVVIFIFSVWMFSLLLLHLDGAARPHPIHLPLDAKQFPALATAKRAEAAYPEDLDGDDFGDGDQELLFDPPSRYALVTTPLTARAGTHLNLRTARSQMPPPMPNRFYPLHFSPSSCLSLPPTAYPHHCLTLVSFF